MLYFSGIQILSLLKLTAAYALYNSRSNVAVTNLFGQIFELVLCTQPKFWNNYHNYYSDSYNCCHKQNPIAKKTSPCCNKELQKLNMLSMESSQHPCVVAVNSTEWGENCQASSKSNIQYWQLWSQIRPVHKFVFHICEEVGG